MQYRVTDTAPPRVAGRSVAPGDLIELSDRAARFELVSGHIIPVGAGDTTAAANEAEPNVKPASKRR